MVAVESLPVESDWQAVEQFSGAAGHKDLQDLGTPGHLAAHISLRNEADAFCNFFPLDEWV
jgi:hypothetical protein